MGKRLRAKLRDRLSRFKRVFGITLTVDGSLFSSPLEAWRYVMRKRLLSLFITKLHKLGFLHSRDYFWVVEWQEETQQAHWHLLVDSDFVPFGEIVAAWSRFRPIWAPRLAVRVTSANYKTLDRPAFGSARFTVSTANAWKASAYATKYLIKTPEYGFPDWVLDYEGRVPRYGHNKGFFPRESSGRDVGPSPDAQEESERPKRCPADCVCRTCLDKDGRVRRREFKTLRERIAQCRVTSTLVRVPVWTDASGNRVEGRASFVSALTVPFAAACELFGVPPGDCAELVLDSTSEWQLRLLECELGGSTWDGQEWEDEW